MKIAMLNCLKANEVCTGAGCLKAFNGKMRHFADYEEPLELVAMARCNGCEAGINAGFQEKLERIVSEGAKVCHLGICTVRQDTGKECPTITQAAQYLESQGLTIVRGTH